MKLGPHVSSGMLAAWLASDVVRLLGGIDGVLDIPDIIVALGLLWLVPSVLRRRAAHAAIVTFEACLITVASIVVPLAYAFAPQPAVLPLELSWLRGLGAGLFAWSACTLGSSFSVLPALRSVVTSGPYRFMRHPMYASYLLLDAVSWLSTGAASTLLIWLLEAALLLRRAQLEEQCLRRDPDYVAYATTVAGTPERIWFDRPRNRSSNYSSRSSLS